MAKWSKLTNIEAKHFGHRVYNLMNFREWDADTMQDIALIADALGRPFDEPLELED